MYGFGVCEIPVVLQIIYFIKILINLVKFIVPIGLIIMVSLDFGKGVISGDKKPGEVLKACSNRIIAAVLIFLIPTIVDFTLGLADAATSYESCWANANVNTIKDYQQKWDAEVARQEAIKEAEREALKKQEEEEAARQEAMENEKDGNDKNQQYTVSNSHTNSINGIKYKLYNQCDERWGERKFGNGSICERGCPIITDAVLASAYDANITPLTIDEAGKSSGLPSTVVNSFSNGSFSCRMTNKDNIKDIINNLKKGNVYIIVVGKDSKFTNSQHYMALIDIKSDESQIFIGNSYDNGKGTYNRNGWFDTDEVLTAIKEVHMCVPSQSLIDKFN